MDLKDWMPIVSGALGATVFGFLGAYFATRGRNLATKADTDFLRSQLSENTTLTKSIERKFSEEDYLRKRELEYRERQLSEFYGPVYGHLKSQKIIYDLWREGKMTEKNLEIKQLFAKQDGIIRDLIVTKAHLIESTEMPPHFIAFLTDTTIFNIYAAGTDIGAVPEILASDPRVSYPVEFDEHVFATTEKLKKRVQELNERYAISLDSQPE